MVPPSIFPLSRKIPEIAETSKRGPLKSQMFDHFDFEEGFSSKIRKFQNEKVEKSKEAFEIANVRSF